MRPILAEDPYVGHIEDAAQTARLVDKPLAYYRRLLNNAPVFCPERRRFCQETSAVVAALALGACQPKTNSTIQGNRPPPPDKEGRHLNSEWRAFLLGQDLIYGPSVYTTAGGMTNDFNGHLSYSGARWGAVDYVSPIGIPLIPAKPGIVAARLSANTAAVSGGRSIGLRIYTESGDGEGVSIDYGHLSAYTNNILTYAPKWEDLVDRNIVTRNVVIGYTGSSGTPAAHLHVFIGIRDYRNEDGKWYLRPPGIDFFKCGHGERPIYHDGETDIIDKLPDTMEPEMLILRTRLEDGHDALEIDKETLGRLIEFTERTDHKGLGEYLSDQVFRKHSTADGLNYKYLPGSFMYSLALEWVRERPEQEVLVTLPYISPFVSDRFKESNPGIPL